jgi:MFS family permease
MRGRAAGGGMALAFTAGFNLANIGAVASRIGDAYGIGLGVVGLFTTGLFVTHASLQVPMGRLCDRLGPRIVGAAGLLVVAAASTAALGWRETWFAIGMRLLAGVGTAAAFVGGGDYVRATIGSPVALGIFGAVSMGSGGLALAVVPLLPGWRAPFAAAAVVAALGLVLVAIAPREARLPARTRGLTVLDRRLLPLAVMHAASFGLSVVLGNWIVTLLERNGGESEHVAGLIGGLVLFVGVASRPLGGRLVDHPAVLAASFVTGGIAIGVLALAKPAPLMVVAAGVVGLAAGIPFAPALAAAQRLRPDAPGAAIGAVNMVAATVILVGTPLLGLTFSLPGGGRAGFVVVAILTGLAALAVRARPA